jgi:uncharacterized membrane protein HdeD (DUF308 family)
MTMGFTSSRSSTDELSSYQMSAALAENWWAVAIRGVLAILFGAIAFIFPGATILSLVIVFAAYVIADGIFAIVSALRAARQHERWWTLALAGVLSIVAGVLASLWPGLTVLAFIALMAAWSIMTGVLTLVAAFRLKLQHGRWWLVLGGIANVVFGVLLIVAPLAGALVLTWWLGAYALVFGALLLALAFRLRSQRRRDPGHPAVRAAA